MPTVRKDSFKDMEIHPFLGLFGRLPVDILESVKNAERQIYFGGRNLNEEHRSIICKRKFSSDDFKTIASLSFHKMLTGKRWRLFH